MQCARDVVTPQKFCEAAAKKMGCNQEDDDICKTEFRNQRFSAPREQICNASQELFDQFAGRESDVLTLGTPSITMEQFQSMIMHAIYELTFLSYFNEPTFNGEPFSGHILESKYVHPELVPNLLKNHPSYTQTVSAP
jgi:hypothetical protein